MYDHYSFYYVTQITHITHVTDNTVPVAVRVRGVIIRVRKNTRRVLYSHITHRRPLINSLCYSNYSYYSCYWWYRAGGRASAWRHHPCAGKYYTCIVFAHYSQTTITHFTMLLKFLILLMLLMIPCRWPCECLASSSACENILGSTWVCVHSFSVCHHQKKI